MVRLDFQTQDEEDIIDAEYTMFPSQSGSIRLSDPLLSAEVAKQEVLLFPSQSGSIRQWDLPKKDRD